MSKSKILVTIGNKSYNCVLVSTEEDRRKGLMNVEYLAPDEGMLFEFSKEGTYEFWMKNTPLELTQISINEDDEVEEVYQAIPNDDTLIPFKNCKYLLEVNRTTEIQKGDEFEIDDSDDLNKYVMKVLAPDGSTQMNLQGGERIFSRISTKKMIKQAKKANSVRDDEVLFERACRKLGKICLKELYAQNHRDQEYVKVPEN
jgi:uncharacterized membrane protein (UPF0127 family)